MDSIKLWSPQSYKDATQAARDIVCNGAGPSGYGWTIPDTMYGLRITEAANIHDWQYSEAKTKDDRLHADLTFLRNLIVLIVQADLNAGWWGRRLTGLRMKRATSYFMGVHRFGGRFSSND